MQKSGTSGKNIFVSFSLRLFLSDAKERLEEEHSYLKLDVEKS